MSGLGPAADLDVGIGANFLSTCSEFAASRNDASSSTAPRRYEGFSI